jgi:DNA-3-methyladenine glycosylase
VRVARALLGCVLHADLGTADWVAARIVEVEAYLGTADRASHAWRGPTRRAAIMFGEPGHLYVYLSYGVHHCANVVTERDGVAGAVLLRAARVERGEEVVRARRPRVPTHQLLSGPGNLCRGLGIRAPDNGADLCTAGGRFAITRGRRGGPLAGGPRVGITHAATVPLRFAVAGEAAVSAPRPPLPSPA